ncbi:hypothetical protein QYF36_022878 [Acer negundo]|nr:hypothetical protein QYF36_022878 [Acer negundo]
MPFVAREKAHAAAPLEIEEIKELPTIGQLPFDPIVPDRSLLLHEKELMLLPHWKSERSKSSQRSDSLLYIVH